MKQLIKKILNEKTRRAILSFFNKSWCSFCKLLPLRNVVFFYTIRADGKLAGNSKILYDALDCKKVIFAHMLPHSKKILPSVYYHLLTSKVIVTDDYLRYMRAVTLRENQKLVQVWHACGAFKKFGLDAPSHLTPEQERNTHSQYDAVCVTADKCKKFYASAFGIDEAKCIPLGAARTDEIVNNPEKLRAEIHKKHPELKGKKVYLYCPTFRECNGKVIEFSPQINWAEISASLDEGEIFIIRRHPIMKYSLFEETYENIIDMSNDSTLELTSISKAIITDYSSVIYDACLLDVPCVFYCPDLNEYERGFYLDFPDDLPGELVTDSEKLLSAIRRAASSPKNEKMENFKKDQMSACDGHSTEKITKLIKDWMK